jgi:hypothetical protein
MSKPHARCYDMECDECLERNVCEFMDDTDPMAVALVSLRRKVNNLSGQLDVLSETVHQTRRRLDDLIAAVVRAAND